MPDWPLDFTDDIATDPEGDRVITAGQARALHTEIARLRAENGDLRDFAVWVRDGHPQDLAHARARAKALLTKLPHP